MLNTRSRYLAFGVTRRSCTTVYQQQDTYNVPQIQHHLRLTIFLLHPKGYPIGDSDLHGLSRNVSVIDDDVTGTPALVSPSLAVSTHAWSPWSEPTSFCLHEIHSNTSSFSPNLFRHMSLFRLLQARNGFGTHAQQ